MFGFLNFFFLFSYVSGGGNSFPKPLTADEEKKVLEEYSHGSEEAKNILIERNLRLVAYIARKYTNFGNDTEDLISIGTIGLIKGISSFNTEKGTRLATYIARCIDNAMVTKELFVLDRFH